MFTRNDYKNILVENLRYCQEHKGLEIFAWCIMTNHIHLIIRAGGEILLQDILRDYKKFTSKAILNPIEENIQESRKEWLLQRFKTTEGFRFWRTDNKPVELWSNKVIDQKIDYLPVRSGGGYLYGINRIGIFGSVAKGNQTENSDIDIYYEGKALSLFKIAALKEELENLLNTTVDIVRVRDSMNGLLKRNIKKEGIYV